MVLRIALVLIAYLIGSIPFGYLIVKRCLDEDIRDSGSGGTGATNVLRKAGKSAAVLTFLLDAAKGSFAVLLMKYATGSQPEWVGAAAVAVILGHIYTVWLGFRGGKGVATGVGVFLVLSPVSVLCALPLFIAIIYIWHYMSLGSIIATGTIPIWMFAYEVGVRHQPMQSVIALEIPAVICCILVIASHHQNIRRLIDGTENKI